MRVLDYFKAKDPRFATANEDKLVLWIGRTKPEFLQDPEFRSAYERLQTPSASLQPQFAQPFAPVATPPSQEQQLVAAAQDREAERRTYEATRSLFADDPRRLATLDAAYAGLREEQGVGLLTDKSPTVPKLTPEVVEQTTGLGPGASKVVAGAQQGVAGLVDFFLTPVGLTTLGIGSMGPGASRMAAAIFAADMAAHYPEQVAGLVDAIQSKDPEATTRSLIGVGLTPLFVKGALSHPSPVAQESTLRTQALLDSAKSEALRLNDPNVSGIPYAEALAMDRAVEPRMTTGDTVAPTYDPLTTFARKLRAGEVTIPEPTPGIALPAARAVRPAPESGRLGWNRTAEEMTGNALPGAFGAAPKEAPPVATEPAPIGRAGEDTGPVKVALTDEQRTSLARNIKRFGWDPAQYGLTAGEVAVLAPDKPAVSVTPDGPPAELIRYTDSSGRGLMNRDAWDMSKLSDSEQLRLPELLELGLEQPRDVPGDATFFFTKEGDKQHRELIRLLTKASKLPVERTVTKPQGQLVWKSGDGQMAYASAAPAPKAATPSLRPEDPLPPRQLTQVEEDTRIASHATMTREQLQAEVAGVGTDRTALQKQYFDELAKTNPDLVNTVATPETEAKMAGDWHNWLAQRTLLHTSAWTELYKRDHPGKPATAALGIRPPGSELLDPVVNWLLDKLQGSTLIRQGRVIRPTLQNSSGLYGLGWQPADQAKTQITSTKATYAKLKPYVAGRTLDYGAGKGLGAEVLGADTFEPYPGNWKPTYARAEDVPAGAYDTVVSSYVLNVLPKDTRSEVLNRMWDSLKPGGCMIVLTRNLDVDNATAKHRFGDRELITSKGTYQVGFSPAELAGEITDVLPEARVVKVPLGTTGVVAYKPLATDPVKPSPAALGIRSPGSEMLDPIVNWLSREAPTGTEVDLVTPSRPIPRLAAYDGLKQTVTRPEGMGRLPWWLPAGRIFDPRYKGGDPVRGAFIVNAWSKGVGDGMAKIVGADLQRFDAAFKGLPMSDLIEAHLRGEPMLNPEQTAAVAAAKPYIDDVLAMLAEEGIPRAEALKAMADSFGGSEYFPRTPIGKEVGGVEVGGGNARSMGLSRTPGSLRERSYASEAEGVAGGIKYEDRFSVRVADHVRQAYSAVANQRLLSDPALKGETVKGRLEALAESNIPELQLAKQALENGGIVQADYDALIRRAEKANPELFEEWRGRAKDTGWGESTVRRAEFRGYIYDAATAAKLEKYLNPQEHEFVKFLTVPSQISKGLVLALDNSAPLVQGLPLLAWSLYKRNNVWGRAVVQNLKAWRNPEYLASYLGKPENRAAATEFVQLGGSLGRMDDFMAGVQEGSFLERFPVTRGVARRAAGAFGAFLDVGKLEMWKALRAGTPRAEWRSVAETVENVLGSARSRTIGTRRGVLDAEQILATAPSYYKSAGNLFSQMFARSASGKLAREAVLALGGGILLTHVAAMYFVGKLSPEEIEDKLKRGDISVPVKLGKQTYNVSASHVLISLSKLAAQLGQRAVAGDKPLTGGGVEDNPLLRWIWAHSGPLVSLGIETVQGRDFLGQPTTFGSSVAKRLTPLWGSQVIQSFKEEPSIGGVVGDSLASAIGINAYTTPVIQQRRMESNRISRELYGRDYTGLNIREQLEVARKVQDQPRFQKKGDIDPRSLANAQWYDAQKLKRITGAVGDLANQASKLDTRLRGYDSKVTLRGVTVPLTDEQQKVLEGFVVEEYKRVLPLVLPKLGRTERIDTRQKVLDEALGKARERAKARFIRADIAAPTPPRATPPSP